MQSSITDSTLIFFGMAIVLAFLGMVLALLGVSYSKLAREYSKLKEGKLKEAAEIELGKQRILEDAQVKAQKIITDAQGSATSMIQASDIFSQEYKNEFRARLLQVIKSEEEEFQRLYVAIKEESNKVIENISKDIKVQLDQEMADFKSAMGHEFDKAIGEVKKQAYARVEQNVSEIVANITKDVLRKALDPETEKELILEALNEAREHKIL